MYPFFIFDLHPDQATDEAVEQRYHELVKAYPPDRQPEQFARIRTAYESLRTEHARIQTRLFYVDKSGRPLSDSLPPPRLTLRKRPSTNELAELLRASSASKG